MWLLKKSTWCYLVPINKNVIGEDMFFSGGNSVRENNQHIGSTYTQLDPETDGFIFITRMFVRTSAIIGAAVGAILGGIELAPISIGLLLGTCLSLALVPKDNSGKKIDIITMDIKLAKNVFVAFCVLVSLLSLTSLSADYIVGNALDKTCRA